MNLAAALKSSAGDRPVAHLLRVLIRAVAFLALGLASGRAWDQDAVNRFGVEFRIAEPQLQSLFEKHVQAFVEQDDPLLSEERFRYLSGTAVQEIRQMLAAEGYFSPQVEYRIAPSAGKLTARFDISPGEPTRVVAVDLRFLGAIALDQDNRRALRERVVSAWPLERGAVLRSADWEGAKQGALRMLQADQFPAARIVRSAADVDPAQYAATLTVELDSGPAFTFGELQISGLEILPESVVSAANTIRPGAPYSAQALSEFQAALQSSGYFTSAFVSVAPDPDRADRAPIRVQVVENTRKLLSLGAGYSTDKGVGVLARYDGSVLRFPGWRARASAEVNQVDQLISGELQLPHPIRDFVPRLGARLKREELEGQTTVSTVLGARLVRLRHDTELAFSAQIYRDRVELGDQSSDRLKSLPLNASATLRRLDDMLNPQRGYALNLQLGGALDEAFSDRRFLRLYGKASAFVPVNESQTIILRGELGAVHADGRDGIPEDFLFRTGGSQSVRGYDFGSLGIPSNGVVASGRYLAVGSMEFKQRVAENWWGALFVDAGGVADSAAELKLVTGYGIGVRWRSPIGPLNVDLAYGDANDALRLHFSVGYAF